MEDTMKSAVLVEPSKLHVTETPPPELQTGQAVIRPTLVGICGSDHSLYRGKFNVPLPVIPGHEAVGRVVKVDQSVTHLAPGQRVAIQPNFPCRTCPVCRAGNENVCPAKKRLGIDVDGVFSQEVSIPADYLWRLPEELTDEAAVFTEPLAVAMHGIRKAYSIHPDQQVLIIGSGVIGSLTLQLALESGAHIAACDIENSRLDLAEQFGANEVFNIGEIAQNHDRFDVIFEACGAPSALPSAIDLAAPGGTIVVLGLTGRESTLRPDPIVRKGLRISGSMIYSNNDFQDSIQALREGRIQYAPLISHRLNFDELEARLADFSAPDRLKMILEI